MREYDPGQGLYYCHVPRTGGAALWSALQRVVPRERLLHGAIWRAGPGQLGHAHYDKAVDLGLRRMHPDARQFVTFLREPFDRMVSWYFYIKNGFGGEVVETNPWDRRFLRVRLRDYGEGLRGFLRAYPTRLARQDRYLPDEGPGQLDGFVFVGMAERMRAGYHFLADTMGVPRFSERHGNQSAGDEPVPEDYREEYRRKHAADYDLYDRAVETWTPAWDRLERRSQ